jgi:hypothetical protein
MINDHAIKLLLLIMVLTLFQATSFAAEWKGIVPGVSTRSDIVRSFQRCSDLRLSCEFQLDGDQIRIVFSGRVQNSFYQCTKTLPTETVLVVEVTPRSPIALKHLQRGHNLRRLGKMSKISAYVDERSGLILKTFNNQVTQLNYVAADSDRKRCEDYYADPIQFVRIVTHCPPVTLVGPSATVTAGEIINFQANLQPDPKMTLVWTVSGGKIVAQAGHQISLDTTGIGGKSLKVTVQALGACSVENSLTLNIQP